MRYSIGRDARKPAAQRIRVAAAAVLACGTGFIVTARPAAAQNLNSLVALYDFDNQDVTNAAATGAAYDGENDGAEFEDSIVRDGSGYAGQFNISESGMLTPIDLSPTNLPDNTIGGWFYSNDVEAGGPQDMLSADNGGFDRGLTLDARSGLNAASGPLEFSAFAGPDNGVFQSGTAVTDGAWHFVASTFSSATGTLTIDVDGGIHSESGVSYDGSYNDLVIGFRGTGEDEFFSGYADDVFVYSKALSASDLSTIQNGGRTAILAGQSTAEAAEPASFGLTLVGLLPLTGTVRRRRKLAA